MPPSTTAGTGAEQRRGGAGLERAELVRGADEDVLDREHAPAQLVGRDHRDGRRADVHADHVDEAAHRQREHRERQPLREPEHDHAHAEERDDDEQRRARVRPQRPAREHQRRRASAPTAGALRSRPSPTGPVWRIVCANTGASAIAPPSSTAKRSSEIAPSRTGVRRMKWMPGEHGVEARRLARRLAGRLADQQDAAEADREQQRPRCRRRARARSTNSRPPIAGPTIIAAWNAIERSAIAFAIRSNGTTVAGSARPGGTAIAFGAADRDGEHEERPELVGAVQRHDEQQQRDEDRHRGRAGEQEPPREAVGEVPGREREQRQRRELGEPDQAEVERRVVDLEDLPADGDGGHLRAEPLDEQRDPEQRVVAAPKRGRQPFEPTPAPPPGVGLHRGRVWRSARRRPAQVTRRQLAGVVGWLGRRRRGVSSSASTR